MPALRALSAQLGGAILVVLMLLGGLVNGLTALPLAALQGMLAALLALLLRTPRWWLPIHLVFLPLVVVCARLGLPNWLWGGGFALLSLVYWSSFRTQVPLFLSNRATVDCLAQALPQGPLRVLDLGSGIGSFARRFAHLRPAAEVTGIESAPGPAWLAAWLGRQQGNLRLRRGDFFAEDWSTYDVVYAFLSPVPMAQVWDKACREMRHGSVLVSNSFEVPGVAAKSVIAVGDRRATQLHCYVIGADNIPSAPQAHLIWPWRNRHARQQRG